MAKKKQPPIEEDYKDDYEDVESLIDSDFMPQSVNDEYDSIGEDIPTQDNLRWELDESEDIHQYLRDLRGEIKNEKGEWYKPKGAKQYINHEGSNAIVRLLRQALSKSVAFGNVDRNEAHVYTKLLMNGFIDELVNCHRDWDFNISKHGSELLSIVEHRIYFHLTKPIGDKTRGHRSGMIKAKLSDNLDIAPESGASFGGNDNKQLNEDTVRL